MSTDDAYVEADKVGDLDRRFRHRAGRRRQRQPARRRPGRCSTGSIRASSRSRSTTPRPISAQTALTIDAMKQDYKRMLSDVAAQQAQVDLDQTNFNRSDMLLQTGTVSQAGYDQAHYTLRQRQEQARSRCSSRRRVQLAKLGGNADIADHRASAISAGAGAGRRGAAPARPHRGQGAVRRHRHQRAVDRAGQVSRGLDDRLLSGRHRSRLGRCQLRRKPS